MNDLAVGKLTTRKINANALSGPPRVSKLQTWIGRAFLKLLGWGVEGEAPRISKAVLIFAPHTTNWDLPIMLAIVWSLGFTGNWMAKKEIFFGPLAGFFKWLGGIPVDRSARRNMVDQMIEEIQSRSQIILGITPEGTRSKTKYWKSGFYRIAHGAQVPLVFGYLDYGKKVGGIGPIMETCGDIEEDMKVIREFFSVITTKYPDEAGEIIIQERASS